MQTNEVFSPLFMGRHLLHLPVVDSTNTYLSQLLANTSPAEGTAVWADEQQQGRGQLGSLWLSAAGENLAISYFLRPRHLRPTEQFCLSQATALAVHSLLIYIGLEATELRIKWSNDLLAGEEKIAGILIENQIQGLLLEHSIIGIGINVNQTNFPSFARSASSVKKKLKKTYPPAQLIPTLSAFLEYRYLQTKTAKGREQLQMDYLQQLYRYQTPAQFRLFDSEDSFTAIICGISSEGHLMLQIAETKEVQTFGLKEIVFL